MPTAAASSIASVILPSARRCLAYGETLAKDIPAEKFGHMPHPNMNHAAFNYGHLSLYPDRVVKLLGREDLARPREGWDKLFAAGCECVEDDGRYPSKEEIMTAFVERYRAALAAIEAADESVFAEVNPMEGRFRELFPTVGAAVAFVMGAHMGMHLGQVSAWRRAIGLPPAM